MQSLKPALVAHENRNHPFRVAFRCVLIFATVMYSALPLPLKRYRANVKIYSFVLCRNGKFLLKIVPVCNCSGGSSLWRAANFREILTGSRGFRVFFLVIPSLRSRVDHAFFHFSCLVLLRSRSLLLSRGIKSLKLYPGGTRVTRWKSYEMTICRSLRVRVSRLRAACLISSFPLLFGAAGSTRLRFRYVALACVIFLWARFAYRLLSISSRDGINTSSFAFQHPGH